MVLLLLACTRPGPEPTDQELHAQALHDGAQGDCAGIHSPSLRGDCLSWQAQAMAVDSPEKAEAVCASIQDPEWQHECWFMVADALHAQGSVAARLCAQTGRFEPDCLGHAVTRKAQEMLASPGREVETQAMLRSHWEGHLPAADARAVAERVMARELAARPKPLGPESFGDAPRSLQLLALTMALKESQCGAGVLAEDLDPDLTAQALRSVGC